MKIFLFFILFSFLTICNAISADDIIINSESSEYFISVFDLSEQFLMDLKLDDETGTTIESSAKPIESNLIIKAVAQFPASEKVQVSTNNGVV
ncbi:hypothetical protein PVAND_015634 [Polypedilum vanderplanki]|uniref:Uncharacterized protein n=1 Tax=Polypedilum vanderplanki TaxID=319348 RepID=A0A9J6BD51_POLVA|nr:hypothetical protein PVAND_015634 [Polypedilum vanderplanki]